MKKISCHTFLCNHKFHNIVNYFSFEVLKKKIWANFQRIRELFTKKIVKKLFKIWSWNPGSEIRDPEKTYSGYRGQKAPNPGSRIRIRNTALSGNIGSSLFATGIRVVPGTIWIQVSKHKTCRTQRHTGIGDKIDFSIKRLRFSNVV